MVKLIEVLDDPTVDKLYIIMDYVKNGSLALKIAKTMKNPVQVNQMWKYFRDIITGLHYCNIS